MESSIRAIFKGQVFHLFLLYFLLAGLFHMVSNVDGFLIGELFGIKTKWYFFWAILIPIIHQIYVWYCWRYEWYQKKLTNTFGQNAFPLYKFFFSILILGRPVSIILLALSNENTMVLDQSAAYTLVVIFAVPAIYTMYSVKKYFGFDRAYGLDHFEPEKVKNVPMVNQGIFKYTPNAMYVFGFMMLYAFAFFWLSRAALAAALFNHLYIWVHYYFTERPDMKMIYGEEQKLESGEQ
jgi:hypothetical protein